MLHRFSISRMDLLVGAVNAVIVLTWTFAQWVLHVRDTQGLNEDLAWAMMFVSVAVLFFRSAFPLTVALVSMAATIVYYPASSTDGPMLMAFVIALYTLAALGRIAAAAVIAGLVFLIVVISEYLAGFAHMTASETLMLSGWIIAVPAIGAVVAHYRRYRAETEVALAETQLRSVAEERLRIARELHDAVGHHLSLINVQTSAALRKLRKDPLYRTEETLQVIAETSRSSLRELRAMVGVLREPGEDSPTGPGPSLEQLPLLVDAARASGLEVELRVDGRAVLPVAVDAAAYRVVQESLTNVLRHAKAQRVQIKVVTGTSTLAVAVLDDGVGDGKGAKGPGNGLTGMRERAESLGGTFNAGPRGDGGFSVEATWPLEVDK
ncbi:sensor histidine kinase [Glycomyces algeriensis]|uniref:histidine kinase n=1 Tax=Glycomyces algeriensis TaxID=256037 RepID=A0A9W6G994_9ACTN|nr:sensor histidine kinase [Glycomyces algeriensis]MDA1364997.1 sensor histidine kinase [Glycomyces algeriensis]MDR7349942.1 signal transduction histidine kinase [Glycomyces algeriensis]GLI42652.1 two-component sensor histidine kinase [Glycomyces algeriensis]